MGDQIEINLEAERVIAFRVEIAKMLGSNDAALMFQQILHWTKYTKNKGGWVYKTAEEMYEETNVTERKQRKAREILIERGFVEAEKKMANGSPTWHYRALATLNTKVLTSSTGNMPDGLQGSTSSTGNMPAPTGKNAGSITKKTHENIYVDFRNGSATEEQKLYMGWLIEMVIGNTVWLATPEDSRDSLLGSAAKQTKLTPKRSQKISSRLKDSGYEACKRALVKLAASDFHRGENDRKWKATVEWLFHSQERIEEWANR